MGSTGRGLLNTCVGVFLKLSPAGIPGSFSYWLVNPDKLLKFRPGKITRPFNTEKPSVIVYLKNHDPALYRMSFIQMHNRVLWMPRQDYQGLSLLWLWKCFSPNTQDFYNQPRQDYQGVSLFLHGTNSPQIHITVIFSNSAPAGIPGHLIDCIWHYLPLRPITIIFSNSALARLPGHPIIPR